MRALNLPFFFMHAYTEKLFWKQKNNKEVEKMSDTNPRGQKRPRDGKGRGEGMPGGRRKGRNPTPCGPERGYGKGRGQKRK